MTILYIFDHLCKYVIVWLGIFAIYTFYNCLTYTTVTSKLISKKENLILEELPGFTLIFIHSVCFWFATGYEKALLLYWGPCYFITAALILLKCRINWKKIAIPSSLACKFTYLIMIYLFYIYKLYLPIYAYSVWIMHDQIKLAWFKNNADRTRRVFEDYWIFRVCYPAFLFIPFFVPLTTIYILQFSLKVLSISIFMFWILGIYRLVALGVFFIQPKIEGFGRDIVYM